MSFFGFGRNKTDEGEFEQKDGRGEESDEEEGLGSGSEEESDEESDDFDDMLRIKPQRLQVDASGELEESLIKRREGWMLKLGGAVNQRGGMQTWRKRWFELTEINFRGHKAYELRYYDRKNGALKGSVGLSEVSIYCESTRNKTKAKNNLLKFEFQLHLPGRKPLLLSCEEEEERLEWIETLNVVISYIKLLTHPELAMVVNGYDPMNEDEEDIYMQGEAVAENCVAYGPGLSGSTAGEAGRFVLQVHDVNDQPVHRGGMPISCTISNEEALYYVEMVDNDNGEYSGFYTLCAPGHYDLSIKLNDEHEVKGSPFQIEIFPSKTIPEKCTAEGEMLSQIQAGIPQTFTIIARDGYGNRKHRGGDPFEMALHGPATKKDLIDNGDGSYTCTLEAQDPSNLNYYAASSLMIMIQLHGRNISNSPFRPIIVPPTASPVNPTEFTPVASATSNGAEKLTSRGVIPTGNSRNNAINENNDVGFINEEQVQEEISAEDMAAQIARANLIANLDDNGSVSTAGSGSRLERAKARAKMAKGLLQTTPAAGSTLNKLRQDAI